MVWLTTEIAYNESEKKVGGGQTFTITSCILLVFAKEFTSVRIFFIIASRWLSAATALGSVGLLRDFDVLISVALNFGVIGRTGWAFSLEPVRRLLLDAGVLAAAPLPLGFRIDLGGLLLHLYCSSFSLSCSCSESAEVLFRMEELILA